MNQQIEGSASSVEYAGAATEVILSAFIPIFPGMGSRAAAGQVRQESVLIQQEFVKRQIRYVSLVPEGGGRGSVFFPLYPNPREIRISYVTSGGQSRELTIPLSSLNTAPSKEEPAKEKEVPVEPQSQVGVPSSQTDQDPSTY